ncbi:secreted RxLR effector protein 161-like [Apium graveolens]|uniref:secreted RxLR effector protein 161-like n=1 Tax=Apium graveolens TaxID=4045 RepID=UPI003D7A9CBD
MDQEIDAIEINQMWELFEAPKGKKPMGVNLVYKKKMNAQGEVEKYKRSFVGSLMYLTATRLGITYGVSLISRFIEQPKKIHWEAEKRILRYVRGTLGDGLYYQKTNDYKVLGYCDSDWAGSVDDSKSTSRNVFFVGCCAITWMSKKQQVLSLSTAHAEYISLSIASYQALRNTWVSEDLKHAAKESPIIYFDRKATYVRPMATTSLNAENHGEREIRQRR